MIKPRISPAASLALGLLAPLAAHSETVFIPEGSAGSVLIADSSSGQPVRRITGVDAVHGLAGAPGVKYLVAGSYAEISREEAGGTAKPENMSEDDHAAHHAKPSAAAMPSDKGLSLVTILDADTGGIVRRIEVPGAVHHAAVSPDGRWAAVTHPAGGGVSLIDLAKLEYGGFIATGPMPNYVLFGPGSKRAYVTNAGNGTLSELDMEAGILTRNLLAGESPEHFVLSGDGTAAFVSGAESGKVVHLDIASGDTVQTYEFGAEVHGVDLSDGGTTLFAALKDADQIASVELATGKIRRSGLSPAPYHLTAISGSTRLLVSSRADPKVWIVDQGSLQPTGAIAIQGEGHQMVVLP